MGLGMDSIVPMGLYPCIYSIPGAEAPGYIHLVPNGTDISAKMHKLQTQRYGRESRAPGNVEPI
jgi:hypothetical protein